MPLELNQGNYNFAVHRLKLLLSQDSKMGSETDIEIMRLTRFAEDYEISRKGQAFEPYYLEK